MTEKFARTNLDIRTYNLMAGLTKMLNQTEARLEAMANEGWDRHPVHRGAFDTIKNAHDCYEEIYNSNPRSEAEVAAAEWLFNGGKLRTAAEMEAWQEKRDKEEYARTTMIRNLGKIERKAESRRKMSTALMIGLIPFIPTIIILYGAFDLDEGFTFLYYLACAVCVVPSYLIAKTINWSGAIDDEIDRYFELKRGGKKYSPDYRNVADIALYAAALHTTARRMK